MVIQKVQLVRKKIRNRYYVKPEFEIGDVIHIIVYIRPILERCDCPIFPYL